MCAIAGVFGNNAGNNLKKMLTSLKHRGPDKSGIFVDDKFIYGNLDKIQVPEGKISIGQNLLSIVGDEVVQPLQADNLTLVCNGEIYNYLNLKKELNYDFETDSDNEVILATLLKYYKGSLPQCIPQVVNEIDGDYAFAVYDKKDLVAVRDPVGVKPLYYGSNDKYQGFASERKALWDLGITETWSLPPDQMLHNNKLLPLPQRFSWKSNYPENKFKEFLNEYNPEKFNNEVKNPLKSFGDLNKVDIKKILKKELLESVEKRVEGLEKVGILFSAGVDSTILAQICKDLEVETELYTVGSPGAVDLNFSEKIAKHMHLPIYMRNVDEEVVRKYTPLVLNAIEEWNIMKLGVGMTAYLAAEMAHENGLRVMLSGQGADELFAGYHRYCQFYQDKGEEAKKDLIGDVENLYHVNLERDDKVTMANSVELRVPYLDLKIINTAMNIPMKYNINGENDNLRKCILREVALELGVPTEIVKRPKKAAQYGSGIDKILRKKVLKDHKYMADLGKSFKFIEINPIN